MEEAAGHCLSGERVSTHEEHAKGMCPFIEHPASLPNTSLLPSLLPSLSLQELQRLQVAVAEKTGPDTYLHASLSSSSSSPSSSSSSSAAVSDLEGKEGGRKRRAVLPGLDSAWAHWRHQLEGTGEEGAMSTGVKR
jgi:hypothetical protein